MIFNYTYKELDRIWVTSDHHFGHENIIKYCDRAFSSTEEMDDELILKWNKVVGKGDVVFHLGDFTLLGLDKATDYFKKLNGLIIIPFITWHHDSRWFDNLSIDDSHTIATKSRSVSFTYPEFLIKVTDYPIGKFPLSFHCSHYPLGEWDRKHYGYPHLHGHSHGSYDGDSDKCIDVGVDCWDYSPISLKTLVDQFDE